MALELGAGYRRRVGHVSWGRGAYAPAGQRWLPGGVVMLHDGTGLGGLDDRRATIEALPGIIAGIRARGMRFTRLDQLLEVEPYREPAAPAALAA